MENSKITSIMEVYKMPDRITCNVSDCMYWDNKRCTAPSIEVSVDGGGSTAHGTKEKTNCHTYTLRR